jgi:hypothetical protein
MPHKNKFNYFKRNLGFHLEVQDFFCIFVGQFLTL